tara:strand:+ start:1074 stop:1916 length:843 start_codon:yes stop_codon:yes gene_type:complete
MRNLRMSTASEVYWNTNLKAKLLRISALTNRGEIATEIQKEEAQEIIASLEMENPSIDTDSRQFTIRGDWELVYTDSELFAGSPFFLFIRELFGSNFDQAQETFKLHRRATSTGRIEAVRQVITDKELRSEVELNVGIIPGPPFSLTGTVISSADIEYEDKFTVKATFKDTVIGESPFSFLLDQLPPLPIKQLYQTINNGKPLPATILTTYYLDYDMRITRTLDDTVFVYTRSGYVDDRRTASGDGISSDGNDSDNTTDSDSIVDQDGETIYLTSPEAGE